MMTEEEILKKLELEGTTRDAKRLQLQTLQTILECNGGVSYLQPYLRGHNAPIDAETFRRLVPISSYDDYADYINRIADGEAPPSVLSVDPLVCFFYSSGTSSMKPKMIPYFDSPHSKAASYLAHQGSAAILRRLFPPRPSVNKSLWFLYAGNVTKTKAGFKVMAASAYPFHSNSSPTPSPLLSMCVSPPEVILGSDSQHQMYCHLLCGLRNPNSVDSIRAAYAVGLVRAFSHLESKWEQLCEDLEHGSVSSEVTDITMRNAVNNLLAGPQPELSKTIRTICEERQWGGILRKLWPNARYVNCVTTGTMEQYYPKLKHYAGEIPVLCGDYFASECAVAINLDRVQPPEMTKFVLLPTAAYFEFLPYNLDENDVVVAKETVDASGVETGKMYEVVVTTYRGLFRYRLGDIVRVVGFHNSSPELQYVMRAPKDPNEVFTERGLMSAMENFRLALKDEAMADVTEFSSYLNLESCPREVKIYVEVCEGCVFLQKEKLEESVGVLGRCCSRLEMSLGGVYNVQRERSDLGPLVVCIVEPGTFERLLEAAMEKGAPAYQYKPPKIIRNLEIVNLMEASAILSHKCG